MFSTEIFLKENLIKGFENGSFSEEQVKIYAFNYKVKGYISEECFDEIITNATVPQEEIEDEDIY